jgi:tripartite-type tricarboxylate transporter receptor subunit TctC
LMILTMLIALPMNMAFAADNEFYKGKTIRMIVGFSPGGGFDTFARALARHIGKYIPGTPKVLVQNMPGAGSLSAANRVYAMQPGDGRTIVVFNAAQVLQAILKEPAVQFDPQKFIWLGQPSVGAVPQVLWMRPQVLMTFDQLLKVKKPVNLGAAAPGSSMYDMAKYYEEIGLKVNIVSGYGGSSRVFAALDRGEIDGLTITLGLLRGVYSRFLKEGKVVPIMSLGSNPMVKPLEGVPTFKDVAKQLKLSKNEIALGEFMITSRALLRLFALPPGTPPERVKVLRAAFLEAFNDPKLRAELARLNVLVAPMSAEQVTDKVKSLIDTSPEILKLYKDSILAK